MHMSTITNISASDILRILPHRHPFLLLDAVSEVVPGERIAAHRAISQNEPWAVGHFPGNPVFPGVLIIEAMAQASAVLGHYTLPNRPCFSPTKDSVLLSGIDKVRMRRKVVPGDVLSLHVRILQGKLKFYRFACQAFVGEELATEAEIVSFFHADSGDA